MSDELTPIPSEISESLPPINQQADASGITQAEFQAMRLSEMAYQAQQLEYAKEEAERWELMMAAVMKLPRRTEE
jgi:hypothetical protein